MADREVDLLVIGAGIVGLATALEITRRFPDLHIAIVEKEDRVAAHQTGHNSGVIHSGLYYRTGSLKARNCVAGASSMKQFCRDHGVPFEECGKLVVATSQEEVPRLDQLHQRGIANGVPGLRMLPRDEFRQIEPHCEGLAALHVPSTGIVDYTVVAQKYAELIRQAGGEIVFNAKVIGLREDGSYQHRRDSRRNIPRTLRHQLRRPLQRHAHSHGWRQDQSRNHSLPRRVLRDPRGTPSLVKT